jgi:hypothetical protein
MLRALVFVSSVLAVALSSDNEEPTARLLLFKVDSFLVLFIHRFIYYYVYNIYYFDLSIFIILLLLFSPPKLYP